MGYTTYWSYDVTPGSPFRAVWPQVLRDTETIIAYMPSLGVKIAGGMGTGAPEVGPDAICFNGLAGPEDEAHETFLLNPDESPSDDSGYVWNFCKTAEKPYDVAVGAVILRCAQLAPEAFVFNSDGGWDEDWRFGVGVLTGGAGIVDTSIRGVVKELFGTDEVFSFTNPMQESMDGPPSVRILASA